MTRTVLQVAQDAARKLGLDAPDVLLSSTDQTDIEAASILNEVAERIVRAHDWSLLTTEETYTGDGTTAAFDLPSDYLRMPKDSRVWSSRWQQPLAPITSQIALQLAVQDYDLTVGAWYLQGGQMKFTPALVNGEVARWLYVSNAVIAPASGANKARFTDDEDTFRLGDRLLELHLIWAWRQRKGLPYAEDMRTAELALAQAISDDRGARILAQTARRSMDANVAYPFEVTP